MLNLSRYVLKNILWLLSRAAIYKHDMKIIVVAGFYGTEIVREGLYQILSTKYTTRRNVNMITWDMSIPLAVLGYKDKRRSFFEWIGLFFKIIGTLLFAHKNPHILILSANCTFPETAKFWAEILKPDCLVILNYEKESRLIENLLERTKKEGMIIYDNDLVNANYIGDLNFMKVYTYGEVKSDLLYNKKTKTIVYNFESIIIPQIVPSVTYPFIAAIFLTAMKNGMGFADVAIEALKFDLGSLISFRIKTNIEKE